MENEEKGLVDKELLDQASYVLGGVQTGIEQADELQEQQVAEDATIQSEQDDPRNREQWGLPGVAEELKSAVLGGVQDTASSIQTFPERALDTITGEVSREKKEKGYYQPEWTPFVNEEDPIITKTWWGQMLRGVVHFGTMAAGVTAATSAAGLSAPAWLTSIAGYGMIRAAGIGAVSDVISHTTDGENALGMMRDRFGWMDTPLSTRDTDHPLMMKFKNIVEGMGIGILFDSAAMALGKGSSFARAQVAERGASVEVQTIRKGIQELRKNEFGFRASKNSPVAGRHQGNHLSQDKDPFTVWERNKRIRTEWGAEEGSAGNVSTPVQRERIARESGLSEELVVDTLSRLYSAEKFQNVLKAVDGNKKRLIEVFGDAIAAHQRITLGRNAAEMTAEEYLEEVLETSIKFDVTDITGRKIDEITTITAQNVVVSDQLYLHYYNS